jgi:hypothetical protein
VLHPDIRIEWIDDDIGYGLFARRPIARGTITWTLDRLDRILSPAEVDGLGPRYADLVERFTYRDRTGRRILNWDLARFMNHSCAPNSLTAGLDVEIAVRDIREGEQVCDDYATLGLEEPFACRCGTPGCRRIVRPDDLVAEWERLRAAALPLLPQVDQPLLAWVDPSDRRRLLTADPQALPSLAARRSPALREGS